MIKSSTLDVLISVVLVVLTLSLVVQTVQDVIKKVLKLKSRQLEASIVDLFEVALGGRQERTGRARLATFLNPFVAHRPIDKSSDAGKLYEAVMIEFERIGRVAATGGRMLESISKEDLTRVLAVVPISTVPGFREIATNISTACDTMKEKLETVKGVLAGTPPDPALAGRCDDASARLATLSSAFKKAAESEHASLVPVEEAAALIASLDTLLKDVAAHAALDKVAVASEARKALEAALERWQKVRHTAEAWFDTVMHGFEERYNRSMRSWSLLISIVVVVFLNADALTIYTRLASDTSTQQAVVEQKQRILDRISALKASKAAGGDTTSADAELAALQRQLDEQLDVYNQFGFKPIDLSTIDVRNPGPVFDAIWRHALGWAIMVMLLSFGAPFWNDTLESLFGVKSLLRKRSDIKNVETKAGAGNVES